MKMLIPSLLILAIIACEKPPLEPPPNGSNNNHEKLNTLWQEPINEDMTSCFSRTPLLLEQGVMFTKILCNPYETLVMRNLEDGNLMWKWEDYDEIGILGDLSEFPINGHIIGLGKSNEVYGVDLQTQTRLWKIATRPTGSGNPRISEYGNWVFHVHEPNQTAIDASHLVMIEAHTGFVDTIYTVYKEDGFEPGIEPGTIWINPKGDTVVIFQTRYVNFSTLEDKVDLFAYNMTADSLAWKIDSITPTGNSSIHLPIISGDRIFFQGSQSATCIDAPTGAILWQRRFPGESFFHAANILVEDRLILNGTTEHIYAISTQTGDLLWDNPNSGTTVDNMVHYKGVVYFGSDGDGKLHAVDINTGEELWAYESPNAEEYPYAYFGNGITIDKQTGYLYTVDNVFAMCIDLEAEEKVIFA